MSCSYGNINKNVNTRLFTRKSPLSILNTDSRLTISESVVESDDSAVESADYMADFTADSMKIVVWICAFRSVVIVGEVVRGSDEWTPQGRIK